MSDRITKADRELLGRLAAVVEGVDTVDLCRIISCPINQTGKGCDGCICSSEEVDIFKRAGRILKEVAHG